MPLKFEAVISVDRKEKSRKAYSAQEIRDVHQALKSLDTDLEIPYTATITSVSFVRPDDVLKSKFFNLAELRLKLAEMTSAGINRMTIYDLLMEIKNLATEEKEE